MVHKLMIVDNNSIQKVLLEQLLIKVLGKTVEIHCFNSISESDFDDDWEAMFVDLYIPGTSRGEIADVVKDELEKVNRKVPVVWLGDDDELENMPYIDNGELYNLEKPVQYKVLCNVLEDILELSYDPEALGWIEKEIGIANCGSEDSYDEAARIYSSTGRGKIEEIREFYKSEDWENYTIKVHALKSSSRIIGAMELGDLAEELEHAGDALDLNTIHEKTEDLLKGYELCINTIEKMQSNNVEGKPSVDAAYLADAYASMYDFACQEDYDLMEMVLDELKNYEIPEEDEIKIKDINEMFLRWDFEGIKEKLS
ncbi:MAG: Hpt domain-containing protein [Lachnospiraceae bacterium]|jgi:HPt (histidine-containing phosphotransfer) domain-containing protein|nr:Hpt domain-containing protein [Lachnospiraceae bacterium]